MIRLLDDITLDCTIFEFSKLVEALILVELIKFDMLMARSLKVESAMSDISVKNSFSIPETSEKRVVVEDRADCSSFLFEVKPFCDSNIAL